LFVINSVTKITTVGKVLSATLVESAKSLVNHVPNETSLQSRVALIPEDFPIQMKIAIRIIHGMTVLAKDYGTVPDRMPSQSFGFFDIGIHRAYNVGEFGGT
jgi:hypothetical protein